MKNQHFCNLATFFLNSLVFSVEIGFGFLRPPRNYILMLPLSKLVAFFGTRVNKMAADMYNAKILTFLLVVVGHWEWALFVRLEKIRNFYLGHFFFKINI